ncbi:hypothetical protein EDC01DRAFT_619885 [Geopyxis carbonaria]|nr:hypothetical protein EDC01DRAFT_619885 [Geopyxis carbonaria]
MSERDHGQRSSGFRASIDGYAAALSPRKRSSIANSASFVSESTDSQSGSSNGNPKSSKNIMSFFSRFGHRNKSKFNVSTPKIDTKNASAHSRGNSLPNTPVVHASLSVKHQTSTPILSPTSTIRPDSQLTPSQSIPEIPGPEQLPLCVARIQAIKTSSLPACTLATEKILRRESTSGWGDSRRSRVLQRSHMPTRSADLDWTKKLFILCPGLILQYSGSGTEDRLPEKIMQLTSNSLAFASDVIPGRPWVLQITRNTVDEGTPLPGKRNTFIAKVTFRGGSTTTPSVLLLVFECAEEMDTWMGLIRAEATRLAGAAEDSVTVIEDTDKEEEPEGGEEDKGYSRRIVISREDSSKNEWSSSDESKRASTYYRTSTDAGRSIISGDQITLDQLRGPSRLSIHSGGGRARVSTVSPDTSPERSSMGGSMSYKRRSAALSTRSRSSVELRSSQHPLSAIDKDGNLYWIPRTPSPAGTPHFGTNSTRGRPLSTPVPPVPPYPHSYPSPSLSSHASQPKLSTVDSFEEIAGMSTTPHSFRPRPVSIQSNPGTPQLGPSTRAPSSKKASSPTMPKRQRPVSMFDTRSPGGSSANHRSPKSSTDHFFPSSLPPARSKSLKRRSLGALSIPGAVDAELAKGAPKHPPPSIPLPAVPISTPYDSSSMMGLSQSVPRGGGEWGGRDRGDWPDRERRERRRRSRRESAGADSTSTSENSSSNRLSIDGRQLGNRHSFCAPRGERIVL